VPGPAGAALTRTDFYQRIAIADVPGIGNPGTVVQVFCDDDNDIIISGGFYTSHLDINIGASYALRRPFGTQGWQVSVLPSGAPGQAQAIAECLRVD
jgi:hypothetical protein